MLRSLFESFFWSYAYRAKLRRYTWGLSESQKTVGEGFFCYYQVHGRDLGYDASSAVLRAIHKFALEFRTQQLSEQEEESFASAISDAYAGLPESHMPSRWRVALERHRSKADERRRLIAAAQLARSTVSRNESQDLDAIRLCKPPVEAKRVWAALSPDFEFPQAVAERTGLDVGHVAYWVEHLESAGVAVRISTADGAGARIRRSPIADEKNSPLVHALVAPTEL